MTASYEPRWDIDNTYGEQGENGFRARLGLRGASFEVKRKRRHDLKFYIELWQAPRRGIERPSGLSTTEASHWVFVFGDTGVMLVVPSAVLKRAVRSGVRANEADGSNPTRGRLVTFDQILQSAQSSGLCP